MNKKLLIGVLIFAFILRLIWVLAIPTQQVSDFKEFDRLAIGLVNGNGYTNQDGALTAYRPPGYIFFLTGIYTLFGSNELEARVANILLGVLTCWLTYVLAGLLFDQRTALISAVIVAFFPSSIAWANILATENLFIPIILCAIITFLKAVQPQEVHWPWLVFSGLLIGIAVLIRPAAILLVGVFFLTLIIRSHGNLASKQGIKFFGNSVLIGIILFIAMLIPVLPWTIRNSILMGHFIFVSTEGGITFLSGHNDLALTDEYSLDGPVFQQLNALKLDESLYDQRAYQLAFQFIQHNPVFEARLIIHKFINFFKDDVSGITYNDLSAITALPDWLVFTAKGIAQIYYLMVMGLALLSIFLKRYPNDRWYLVLVILIIGWTILHLAFYGKDRFRFPLTPAFAQFAAVSVIALLDKFLMVFSQKNSSSED